VNVKILVFTEGTLTIHRTWAGLPREEMVRRVKESRAPKDYANSIPIGCAVEKLHAWKRQGAEIMYLTSRTSAQEIQDVQNVLRQFAFPEGTLYFRRKDETYAQVAERVMPDVIIEDDCESIGREAEMTYPHIRPDLQARLKSVVVKEFGGIDHLPDNVISLTQP
jgi:hypothetical protein